MREYNNELVDWISNYSINQYNENYKLCVDLTYKYAYKNEYGCRRKLKELKGYFNNNGYEIDGVYVSEFDKNWNLHNHILMWFNCDEDMGKSLINNNWKSIGCSMIRKYEMNLGYEIYITKHLNKTINNNWDFMINL